MENQGISLIPEVPNIERQDTNSAAFESCLFPNIDCNAVVQEKYWNMYTPLESSNTDTKIYTFETGSKPTNTWTHLAYMR